MEYNAVYFGSFNPVHRGHIEAMRSIFSFPNIKSIDIVLTPHNPDKDESSIYPYSIRKELIKKSFYRMQYGDTSDHTSGLKNHINTDLSIYNDDSKYMIVNDIETTLTKPNHTYKTIRELKNTLPNIAIVLGTDTINDIHNWENSEELICLPIIHLKRCGYEISENASNYNIIHTLVNLPNVSSTEIRNKIKNDDYTELQNYIPYYMADFFKDEMKGYNRQINIDTILNKNENE